MANFMLLSNNEFFMPLYCQIGAVLIYGPAIQRSRALTNVLKTRICRSQTIEGSRNAIAKVRMVGTGLK